MGNPYEPLSKASTNLKKDKNTEETATEPVESTEDTDIPTGKIPEILEWVGEDKDRAKLALDAENEQENPRKTLVKQLEEVING